MLHKQSEKFIHGIMRTLDIQVDGTRPWDVRIHNPLFYERVATQGSMGLGEAYEKVAHVGVKKVWKNIENYLVSIQNQIQRRTRAFIIGKHHYDLGNDLFSIMLDKGLNYSCAYCLSEDWLETGDEGPGYWLRMGGVCETCSPELRCKHNWRHRFQGAGRVCKECVQGA